MVCRGESIIRANAGAFAAKIGKTSGAGGTIAASTLEGPELDDSPAMPRVPSFAAPVQDADAARTFAGSPTSSSNRVR